MSTALLEWNAPDRRYAYPAKPLPPLAIEEARRHPALLAAIFAAIALGTLLLALLMSKTYTASTTILVDEENTPLASADRPAPPKGQAHAAAAREIALGRKGMGEILKAGGWMDERPDAVQQERLARQIAARTDISSPRQLPNLIQVSYSDNDPTRAYQVTRRIGEVIISESQAVKSRSNREAYEFLDDQVAKYQSRLNESENRLSAYRQANPDARIGSSEDVALRITELRRAIDGARLEQIDAGAQVAALRSQFAGQTPYGMVHSRSSQAQARIAELQGERDQLLLKYTEQHPDVVQIDSQIRDLQSNAGARPGNALVVARGATGATGLNPYYNEIKGRLADASSRAAASASRIAMAQAMLDQELQRSTRVADSDNKLAGLTRDFEVNRDIYQGLMKRRENARVAMNLDAERGGTGLRIQEPAAVPLEASGLRPAHVAGAGLLLATLVPALVLFGWLKLDPRVRSAGQIEQLAQLPVLGSIPPHATSHRRAQSKRKRTAASMLLLAVALAYALVMILKWTNVL